jgi:hypothetical protein
MEKLEAACRTGRERDTVRTGGCGRPLLLLDPAHAREV